jgi:hypothetical protein
MPKFSLNAFSRRIYCLMRYKYYSKRQSILRFDFREFRWFRNQGRVIIRLARKWHGSRLVGFIDIRYYF